MGVLLLDVYALFFIQSMEKSLGDHSLNFVFAHFRDFSIPGKQIINIGFTILCISEYSGRRDLRIRPIGNRNYGNIETVVE